jgi:type IV secretory pathway TraG/TraD family ATPase VirD4
LPPRSDIFAPQITTLPIDGDGPCVFSGVFFGKSSAPELSGVSLSKNPGAPICSRPGYHCLIVGRAKAGKGTRVIVPTLLRYRQSCLVVDPGGATAIITARARAEFSNVHVVNPWGEIAETFEGFRLPPATFNPLDVLNRKNADTVTIAKALAITICPYEGKAEDVFWSALATNLLTAVLLWLADRPDETVTLARVVELAIGEKANVLPRLAASEAFGGAIVDLVAPLRDMPAATYGGVTAALAKYMVSLSGPQIQAATAASTFAMEDLAGDAKGRPTTVYLVVPSSPSEAATAWLRLMVGAALRTFRRKPIREGLRCLCVLDDVALLGRLDDLPREFPMAGAFGLDFLLAVQSVDQLRNLYGGDHATLIENTGYKWFSNVNDLGTLEFLAGEGLGSIDEILDLGRNVGILLTPEGPPQFLRPIDYWDLQESFGMYRKTCPDLYWPLDFDPNPYLPMHAQRFD